MFQEKQETKLIHNTSTIKCSYKTWCCKAVVHIHLCTGICEQKI